MLLVGGGVASVRCARTLRRHGFDGRIVLVGAERTFPYNRPPLSKELLREALPDELVLAEPETWYARRGVDLRLETTVAVLDVAARTATLADGTTIAFEHCLLATGAEPRRLPIDGADRALVLRTIEDSRAIRAAARPGSRAVVVGGGFIGVEVASSLATLGLDVTIAEMSPTLWGGSLGPSLSGWVGDRLGEAGITVLTGATVDAIEPDGVWVGSELLPAELVVAGIGVIPRVELARDAGLDVDDGVITDARHETSAPGIYAAGDVARVDGLRFEHWHAAREGGERAALSMLGQSATNKRAPWVFSEVAGIALDVFGLAPAWDEERWVRPGSVLAYLAGDRVVQLAVIGSALAPEIARTHVEAETTYPTLERSLAGASAG